MHRCPTPVLRKALLTPSGMFGLALDSVRSLAAGLRLVRRIRPEMIYVNTITIPLWSVVAALTGTPLLIHIHEAEGTASRVVRKLLASPLFLADALVTNSHFSEDVLASSFRRLAGRSRIVSNGVIGPAAAEPASGVVGGTVKLVFVGRLSHRKGPDLVVDAVADLARSHVPTELHLVGAVFPGNEVFEEELRERVSELDLTSSVHFHGFQHSVWPFLADAHIVVVPSRVDEPFGNTAVEAMLAMRPAIVSDTSGLREASAGFGSVIRVTPGSSGAIADGVRDMVSAWPRYRDAATVDAGVAGARNGIAAYRRAVTDEVTQLLRRSRR